MLEQLAYTVSAALAAAGTIAYVAGRSDVAKSSWAWAVAVAVLAFWLGGAEAPSIAAGEAAVFCPPQRGYVGVPVTVVVSKPGAKVSALVDWGDNTTSRCSGESYCAVSHAYGEPGTYTVRVSGDTSASCTIVVESLGALIESALAANATCSWDPRTWPDCIRGAVLGAVAWALGRLVEAALAVMGVAGLSGVAVSVAVMLVTVPESAPAIFDAYPYASYLLGMAAAGLILWRAYWEFERGLSWLDTLREAGWAVAAVALAQPAYTWAAQVVNAVSLAMAQPGYIVAWMSVVLAFTGLYAALPLPGAGALAAVGVAGFAATVLIALLKYLLMEAIYLVLPIVAALWLFPGTRGVARSVVNTLVALMVWNIVVAAMVGASAHALARPAGVSPLEALTWGLALPAAIMLSAPAVMSAMGVPFPGTGLVATVWSRLAGLATAVQAATPAAVAAPGAVVGVTEYVRHPAATVAAMLPGAAARPTPTGYELRGVEAARAVAVERLGEAFRAAGMVLEKPVVREHRPLQAVRGAVAAPARRLAERVSKEIEAVRQAASVAEGRGARAAAAAGAVTARLYAYMESRARAFARDFAVTLERTGIRLPQRLRELRPLSWSEVEERVRAGAEAAKTIYLKTASLVARLKLAAGTRTAQSKP